jgi:hypothetical protein
LENSDFGPLDLFRISDFEFRFFGRRSGGGRFESTGICSPIWSSPNGEEDRWFVGSAFLARKFEAENATTDFRMVLDDSDINAVLVAVGHHPHSSFDAVTSAREDRTILLNQE